MEQLKDFFVFLGLSEIELENLLSEHPPSVEAFSRGNLVFSKNVEKKKIGFILDGKCEVRVCRADSADVVVNVLKSGDSFGVLAAFSENKFPTEIVAVKASSVAFFDKEDIISFINSNGKIAMNVIRFMANRIEFLNEKIATFSGASVEQKLSSYILSEAKQKGESFDFNRKKTAEAISAGRASVYRVLDSFVESRYINYDSKKIYIIDREGLERISK